MIIKKGSTDVSVELYIVDEDGLPETGLLYDSAGIDLNYRRDGAAVTSITEADLASLSAVHADGGFKEIANGRYRLDVPDAAFATGVDQVTIGGTVTGSVVMPVTVQLVDYDLDSIGAKTNNLPASPAAVGSEMDLIDSPNATAVTAFVTALLAGTCDTGVSLAKAGEMIAALAAGKVSASSDSGVTTLTYKKRDGSTTSFTVPVTESDKTRATTGALS